jgi:hypothetical protein
MWSGSKISSTIWSMLTIGGTLWLAHGLGESLWLTPTIKESKDCSKFKRVIFIVGDKSSFFSRTQNFKNGKMRPKTRCILIMLLVNLQSISLKSVITCRCKQDKVNNLITLSKLEQIDLK